MCILLFCLLCNNKSGDMDDSVLSDDHYLCEQIIMYNLFACIVHVSSDVWNLSYSIPCLVLKSENLTRVKFIL